jgi:hypothetical protein
MTRLLITPTDNIHTSEFRGRVLWGASALALYVEAWRMANGLGASVMASFVNALAVVTPVLTAIGLPKLALK